MPPTDNNSHKPSILKSTREAKGLTLEIVHEATKIPMDALRAIEEGYSVRILSPFYYRGFIKIYAEFLGLDVGEMYKHYGLNEAAKPASSATTVSSLKPVRKEVVPNVFIEQAQDSLAFVFKPQTFILIFKIIGILIVLFLLFKVPGCIASHMHKKEILPKRQAVQRTNHESSVQAPSQNDKVEVAVRASKDLWLRVKADDRVVFETTLSKGSMESWTADNHIELSGRDIELLDMEVNGKQIGFLGGGDRRIKRVLITQEGLTVKK